MQKVSIVIPIYNAERYLYACLESVCGQTYHNLEILCDYDASADGSFEILKSFASRDERIKIITHGTERHSPGFSRNAGMEQATGEFIRFVDADDVIPPESTQELVECINSENHDAARGSLAYVSESLKKIEYMVRLADHKRTTLIKPAEQAGNICSHLLYGHYAYLFRIKDLRRWNAQYSTAIRVGEDKIFLNRVIFHIQKLCITPRIVYYYRNHPESAMTGKKDYTWFSDIVSTYQDTYEQAGKYGAVRCADYQFLTDMRADNYLTSQILPKMCESLSREEQNGIFSSIRQIMIANNIFQRLTYQDICTLGIDWNISRYLLLFCIWIGDFSGSAYIVKGLHDVQHCPRGPCCEFMELKNRLNAIYMSKSWKTALVIKKIYNCLRYFRKAT